MDPTFDRPPSGPPSGLPQPKPPPSRVVSPLVSPLASRPPPPRSAPLDTRFSARPPAWLDLFDPRQPEAFLAVCSTWCALQLCIWPSEFDAANAVVTRVIGLRGHEQIWAIVGLVAAVLKLAGLASRMSPRWAGFASGLRASGLFMSILFWLIVGLSCMLDLPHTIVPVVLTGLGIGAAYELAEQREPREAWR